MNEINKLRARLKNVGKTVIEYRMTVDEANNLLAEIDMLLKPKPVIQPPDTTVVTWPKIFDGGSFE